MIKIITYLFIFISSLSLLGQSVSLSHNDKYQIGINYSINNTFRVLKNDSKNENFDNIIDSRNKREKSLLNNSLGINFILNFKDKMFIETGVTYSIMGYQTKEQELLFSNLSDPRKGFTVNYSNLPTTEKLIVEYAFIKIPTTFNVTFIDKKISVYGLGGISTNFLLYKESTYEWLLQDGSIDIVKSGKNKWDLYNTINFSAIVGLGLKYSVNEKIDLRLTPNFEYSFTSFTDSKMKEYPYSYGVQIKLFYTL
ncbi:MAG: outer membrane beta-barrel protein [Flavobacteriales bacterium]|nr:outer membrane beta-barrel protein [Flavobacteriales bacterium]MCW8913947.1 outer membrane beta-barrel protein [Flavobacteriales bacterium]MCW8937760.1 outer membrane beta-barrel protein [Flavobacteriales bacterium]MCW8939494.1 outer membrane beta-barrel protein [Flavobacteriales bacterium]MCW8969284.1 outer membrane beta-barrel protein [Flavobacteriales bacterium]